MQKIIPNIWCNGTAEAAAEFYTNALGGKIVATSYYPKSAAEGLADFQLDMAGKVLTIDFEVHDQRFTLVNADATFMPNPAISFMVNFDPSHDEQAGGHLDKLWGALLEGGEVLMPLDAYPFSKRYGWVSDKYGVTWQLILTDPEGEPRPFIVPSLLFGGPVQNQAEEALQYYQSVFKNSKPGIVARYGEPTGLATKDSLMFADTKLENQWFALMDSGVKQEFTFNEGISLAIFCKDQAEIDYYWEKLSTSPENEQCGWCKDKFGVSWQVVPANIEELMKKPGAYKTMMKQHKIIIAEY